MNKQRLDANDKARLREMVIAYMNPPKNFSINNRGEVSISLKAMIVKYLSGEEIYRHDFLGVTQGIMDAIMEKKEGIPYVMQLLGKSIGSLIETNDRAQVIKTLYLAHLTDEQPGEIGYQGGEYLEREPSIMIEERTVFRPKVSRSFSSFLSRKQQAMEIAESLNAADVVIEFEKKR